MLEFSLRPSIFVSVVCSLVLTSEVSAATVTSVGGTVSINGGNGFARISGGTSAKPGDLVMAGLSGRAEIAYDDGCRVKVEPGTVVTVAETPPCNTPSQENGWVTQTTEQKSNMLPYVLGAAAIGGGVGIALALGGGSNKPSSP
jgi:hypothetical protein